MRHVNLSSPTFVYDDEDPPGFRSGMHRFGTELGATQTGASLYELLEHGRLLPRRDRLTAV